LGIAIAEQPDTIVATFGDMLRVSGSNGSLEIARARGSDVRIVYSPLDALQLAAESPAAKVVFLGVGFETTVPTVAWTIKDARTRGVSNFYVLCAHKTIPEAMAGLAEGGEVQVDGFLCPGHVSVIIGSRAFENLARDQGLPCVVTGFEAGDMARGIRMVLQQLVDGRSEVEIEYTRSVTVDGNTQAQAIGNEVFEKCDAPWRGLGTIPASGLRIRPAYAAHDAGREFDSIHVAESADDRSGCRCGDVLRGALRPPDCGLFGRRCTPADPVGPCMVSSEGSCAAYFKYEGKPRT
jgi:hydrogenase expression/formation protein HypD